MQPSPITRIYRACNPIDAIGPDDQRWVDLDQARGHYSVVKQLARGLRATDPDKTEIRFLAGHIGVGKSSALKQLAQQLRASGNGRSAFLVIEGNVNTLLDVNDLDFPDLVVFIAHLLTEAAKRAKLPGFDAGTTLLRNVWDGIVEALGSEVSLKEGQWEGLTLEFRNRPGARSKLRGAVEAHQSSLLKALNDLLDTARGAAAKAGLAGVVLLIDGLDRLGRVAVNTEGMNPQERLFVGRAAQLCALRASVVYTIPISLVYEPKFAQTMLQVGEAPPLLSMIPLGTFEAPNDDDSQGMHALSSILDKRCASAQIDRSALFDTDETGKYLCRMSGGHPRHLMMLLQSACDATDDLPLRHDHVTAAVRNYANSLARLIPDAAWPALISFDKPQRHLPTEALHQGALLNAWIFEYMNGEPWYQINPVIRTIGRYRDAIAT